MEPETPENWCCSLSEYSRLASLTSLLNLYFDSYATPTIHVFKCILWTQHYFLRICTISALKEFIIGCDAWDTASCVYAQRPWL